MPTGGRRAVRVRIANPGSSARNPGFDVTPAELITGRICGVTIQEIDDPLMKQIRYLDKLVEELAQDRALDKILRTLPESVVG